MQNLPPIDRDASLLAARRQVLSFLALAASDPSAARFARLQRSDVQALGCAAARFLAEDPRSHASPLAPGELSPDRLTLEPLVEALAEPARLEREHVRVFGLVVSKECPPYETQYCPQTFSIYRSQRLADVAGFYHAFGLEPGRDAPERPDHIASELEFQAWLVAKEIHALRGRGSEAGERARVCREAQRSFLAEHLSWWVPAFAHALGSRARSLDPRAGFHVALADALAAWVPLERALLGVAPPDLLSRPVADAEATDDACASCLGASG